MGLTPPSSDDEWRSRMDAELEANRRWSEANRRWRESAAFKELRDTFSATPLTGAVIGVLVDAGYDLKRAAAASDADLLAIRPYMKYAKGLGPSTVAKFRAFLASACPHCGQALGVRDRADRVR